MLKTVSGRDPEFVIEQALANPELALDCLNAADAQDSLMDFINLAWPVLEPGTDFVTGQVVEVIAEHLEAVAKGKIKRLLINVPPGPGWVENRVSTKTGPKRLGDVCVGDEVLTHESRYRRVTAVLTPRKSKTVLISTCAGRTFVATPEHMILTSRGWTEAGSLNPGNVLKVPVPPNIQAEQVGRDEARLLGYLVGDGSLTHGSTPNLTTQDEEVVRDACRIAEGLGFKVSVQRYEGKASRVSILGGVIVRSWLARHGLDGKSSYDKAVPDTVLSSCNEVIRHFLGGYWSADGNVDVRETRSRGSVYRTSATTVSKQLAISLQEALVRLGVRSHLRQRARKAVTKAQPGGEYVYYTVEVHAERDSAVLADCPMIERKRSLLAKCRRGYPVPFIEDEVLSVEDAGNRDVTCVTVDEDHSLTWSGVAVTNCMKSLGTDVFWPAWIWGPCNQADKRFVSWSYAQDLTVRDNKKTRRLILSEQFQRFWSDRFELTGDQNAKKNFENDRMGFKMAEGIHGQGTGHRGDFLVIDDPHNVKSAESDIVREDVLHFFTEVLPTRVNNKHSAIVVIMQRVHERDVSGHILANDLGFDHLCLPMEYEVDHPFPSNTALGFRDWRTKEGELLWPERFDREQVEQLKKVLRSWGGEYAVAGQLQQRPVPRGGGMFKKKWLEIVDNVPSQGLQCRGWDLAGTEDDKRAAFTAGIKMLRHYQHGYFITGVKRGRWSPGQMERELLATAENDGKVCWQSLPQDPGQAGKSQKRYLANLLSGFKVHFSPESGSKDDRARPWAAQAEAGNVKILKGDWNDELIRELTSFPNSAFKDQADAGSRAFAWLSSKRSRNPGAAPKTA